MKDLARQTVMMLAFGATCAWSVDIFPGTNIQSVVDSNGAGTAYALKSGTHRLQAITPKDGDSFTGETGTILNGAGLLTSFSRQSAYWVATGQTQKGPVISSPGYTICKTGYDRCMYPEDLFFDGVPLRHVDSLAKVGPGNWYFDYPNNQIFFADDPTGRTVETSVVGAAFLGGASNVTIQNLTIEKYATSGQRGAVNYDRGGNGWIVQNNEIRYNHGGGLWTGSGMQVLNNKVHHNGQMGIFGGGANLLVQGNEIAFNNNLGFNWGWEAGGTKFVQTTGLVVRGNNSHDNDGAGLWTDGDNMSCLYENNTVTNNGAAGIMHEISQDCIIRNNTLRGNGHGYPGIWYGGVGILISASRNVEVYGNTLVNNEGGIGLMQTNRGNSGLYGFPNELHNVYVHNNAITMIQGSHGAVADTVYSGGYFNSVFTSWNNRFDYNTYQLQDLNGRYFTWTVTDVTKDPWVNTYGQDAHSTFGPISSNTTPPVISGVAVSNLSAAAATISWATDKTADSQVEYGQTTGYGQSSSLNSTLVTSHNVGLTGLSAGTLYHYRVKSKDAAGNLATSGDSTFTTSAPAPAPSVAASFGSKTIDGDPSDWTVAASSAVNQPDPSFPEPNPTAADLSASFRTAWDNTYLYVLAQVSDDQVQPTGGNFIWENDGIEIMIDGLHDRSTVFNADDHQIFITAAGVTQAAGATPGDGKVIAAAKMAPGGYVVEAAIRWDFINGNAPQGGRVYGFDIDVNDRDNNVRESNLHWHFSPNYYQDTSGYGDLTLLPAPAISVSMAPPTASLGQGQTQSFTATVTGSANTTVTWSITPNVGTISNTGLYTAPGTINMQQSVMVTATSLADASKSALATVTLNPPGPSVSLSLTPQTAGLNQGQSQQFTATVTGSANTTVTWSISPNVGIISGAGVYTAPTTIATGQTVTATAVSSADGSKSATASITLIPSPGLLNWTPPILDWPAAVAIDQVLQVTYDLSLPVASIGWDFVPLTRTVSAPATMAARAASAPGTASFTTTAGALTPANQGLSAGTYQVTVKLIDADKVVQQQKTKTLTLVSSNLSAVRVYPNPWRKDKHDGKKITFKGLSIATTIKLFTVSGHQVIELHTDGPSAEWDLTNDAGEKVASGVYVYLVTTGQGEKVKGKVAVLR